jgi:hypothetical protein
MGLFGSDSVPPNQLLKINFFDVVVFTKLDFGWLVYNFLSHLLLKNYRIILYKQLEGRWHYVRLSTTIEGQLLSEMGICGQLPNISQSSTLPQEVAPDQYLRQTAESWNAQGYEKPAQSQLQVMTLHFQMRRWTGYPAGAPWYDDWTTGYIDPILELLDKTCNGIPRGNERFSGNYLHYFVIFNTDLALESVEQIAAAAPVKFLLDIHFGRREKQVQIPIDPNVPEYLRTLFRIVEKSARSIASELPVLFQGDPLQPELLPETRIRTRISGEKARYFRQALKEKWNFDDNFWDPLTQVSPQEVVFLNGMAEEKKQSITTLLETTIDQPIYLLDCEEGLFEIDFGQVFSGSHEGIVFDETFSWVIYFSHHYTITFGGDWLVPAVKDLYTGEEEKLNAW